MQSKLLSTTLFFFLTCFTVCSAEEPPRAPTEFQTKLEIGQGLRRDHLKWSISGLHKKPNVLSELDFKNVKIYMTTIKGRLYNGTYIGEIDFGYGDVFKGTCRDSDYALDDRKAEFSRTRSKIPGSYNFDSSLKFGRIFHIYNGSTFTSSIGYATYLQKYDLRNGQRIPLGRGNFHEQKIKIPGLKSSYKARWSAPFVDFALTIPVLTSLHIDIGYTLYYPVIYVGHGHWNLRRHPGPNYTQKAHASKSFGQKGEFGVRYACTSGFEIGFKLGTMQFFAHHGFDRWDHRGKTPLRKVHRTAVDYMLTASYSF